MALHRRDFLKTSALESAALAQQSPGTQHRPNFLFIIADDLTYRGIHSLNNPEIETPNLDRICRSGCAFTNTFHQGSWSPAVCVASRTMLNTGLFAFRAQKEVYETPLWGQTMGNAGYDTFIVGKWHLDPTTLQRSFKEMGPIGGGMFESGPAAYNRPSPGNTWTPWDRTQRGQWIHTGLWQNSPKDQIRHSAEVWADGAVAQLQKVAKRPSPFFMYVGFTSPHDPRQAPREYVDRYPRERIEIPPNYLPQHPFDQGDNRIRDEVLAPFPRTKDAVRLHRSEYYAHTTFMDAQIGRILDALEKTGKAANTYVIFTSDHGLAVGEHGLMGKQNMYDHSSRVPLLISGPGIPKARRVDQLVYQHSVFPTACELSGVAAPQTVEFPSFADLAKGGSTEKHDAVFCWYRDFQRAVRTTDHKLIYYPAAGVTQLFDLTRDPWEIKDVATDSNYSAVRAQLEQRLKRFRKELGDPLET